MDEIMLHIVNNIFLPRKLPQESQSGISCGGAFVRLVADVLAKEMVEIDALNEAARMMDSWARIQQEFVSWEAVNDSIKALLPGQTFALFVLAQNSGLTISIPAAESTSATLAVFRVAASSTEVMNAPGDLSGIFPGWAVTTYAERVQNRSFAKQVADLANTPFEEMLPKSKKAGTEVPESRDVADASYVMEWLLPAVAGHSLITGKAGVVRMRKKIRDDVLWKSTHLPWRRSGEYMTVKVVLQSTLMGRLGEHDGLIAYKLIILRVMIVVLHSSYSKLDTDVTLQMLSKLARRLSKLEQLSITNQTTQISHLSIRVQEVLKQSCQIVTTIRAIVDKRWQKIIEEETLQSQVIVDANKLDFKKHTKHSLQTAKPHLQVALSTSLQPAPMKVSDPECFHRNKLSSWPNLNLVISSAPVDIGEWLYDIETWVRDILWPGRQDNDQNSSTELFNLLMKYINFAKQYYGGDAFGSSRMILTTVTIVAVLDCLAGLEYPMLRDYNHGVDTTVLESLLLPHRVDMEHLLKLESYFFLRVKNQIFESISLISEDEPSPQAFSVRCAQRDSKIQNIKNEILEFARQKELEKLEELSRERKKYDNFVRSAAAMSCDVNTDEDGFERHARHKCKKCRLEKKAANMRVKIYEFPLPQAPHLQDAVLYELVAPISSFTVLRDALHVLNRDVFGVKLHSEEKKGIWLSHEPLKRWFSPQHGRLTTLCSTSKLFADSHYSRRHPSNSNESFIKPNGFKVRLMEYATNDNASVITYRTQGDVSSLTTLDADGAYKCLQWTIDGTSHTENQVLARQAECPLDLNLSEYKAFGTLRAGQLLQIRNITRVLEMQTLSLSQPSVVNLFAQALWQTGPLIPGEDPGWFRESHLDLREESFARYVIKQLHLVIENNRENWKDHLALLSIVIIGARVLAMSEVAWEQAAGDVLCGCRAIAENWLDRIEQVLGTMMASPINEVQKMCSKLIDVAAVAALTFDVDVHHLKLTMRNKDDVTSWLRAVARIHDNTVLNSESPLGTFQRSLLQRVQNTALRLEETLTELIRKNNCLNDFVLKHWTDGKQGQIECWMRYSSPCERWWKSGFKHVSSGRKVILQMDTLGGSFLVDGRPVARLPAAITGHQDYRRVFGSHVFNVQPAAVSSGTFVSVHKLNNSVFTFALDNDNRLVVKERRHDGCELELFPSRFLNGDLPRLLIEHYSHWILKTERGMGFKQEQMDSHETDGRMLFRPMKFDDNKFADAEAVPFVLNIGSSCVHDTQRDRDLVDVRSPSFKELYDQVLCRLELPYFIHVFVGKLGDISAELPRMGLSFDVNPKLGILWSREQPGFFVPKEQSLGTLVGLYHGLLLKEDKQSENCILKRSLIVPHSTDSLNSTMENHFDCGRHPVVKVNLAEFSSPSFFVFDVDDRLRCLRGPASPTAWLYLALLHASTSHLLPDPFTGLTGTESAMRLIQSPRCWSCKPYEPEAIAILLDIAKLSPSRDWYPKHLHCMQTITWPTALFSSTALDAFCLVVWKLVEDSERLRVLFPGSDKPPMLPQADLTLSIKSYWRSRESFGQEAQMNFEFEKHIGGPPIPLSTTMNMSAEEYDRFKHNDLNLTVRSLAEIGHTSGNIVISDMHPLRSLLLNCATLGGATDQHFSSNPIVSSWRQIAGDKFADHWLNLYNFARQAVQHNCHEEFTLLLSLLAFLRVEPQLLFILLCVALHAEDFESVDPPVHESYEFTNEADLDVIMVESKIKFNSIDFDVWRIKNGGTTRTGESRQSFYDRQLTEYQQTQAGDIRHLAGIAQSHWPTYFSFPSLKTIDSCSAARDVYSLFTRWSRNKELHAFVSNVEEKILKLSCQSIVALKPAPIERPFKHLTVAVTKAPFCCTMPVCSILNTSKAESIFQLGQFGAVNSECIPRIQESAPFDLPPHFLQVDETSCEIAKKFHADLRKSWSERHNLQAQPLLVVTQPSRVVIQQQLLAKLRACKIESTSLWRAICTAMKPRDDDWLSQALEAAGLWRRVLPVVLLPCLVSCGDTSNNFEGVRVALGALAVLWTLEQQAERCLRLLNSAMSQDDVALQRELANTGHLNWRPKDRPEWLILELEGDYLMRTIQVDVANRMLRPDGNENAVLQLNMGEGKTSVIVPALCASIPDGEQFARLTVLSSLFRINFDVLAFKLGGLLNRRVYTFPSRRDIKVNVNQVKIMKTVYQECIAKLGVVVTRPEHTLSSQLMVLELCRAGPNAGPAAELRDLQELVNSKARDILDESDLILQVKYQVVYTIGEQMNIDGGALRWKVSQSVLRSAQQHCNDILNRFGADSIEFKAANEGPFVFPHVRLLSDAVNISLCEMIADDMLAGRDDSLPLRELRWDDARLIRSFILPSTNIDVSLERIQSILPDGPLLETVLILRGLLCYGVLMHALRLRWRVQFGVRPSGQPKMAVPFRAKDVPVERAEYGHPDVAIMLTQLSYYNSGLSDVQLLDAFERLNRLSTCQFEYMRWLEDVPAGCLPESLHTLSSVNLDDYVQRTEVLFPILRRNMRVVDFWLSTAVFPVESKQFKGKLVASAWDLCGRTAEGRPVSGFSGTKDTTLLLPPSIIQHDLPELQGTDGVVIENLLRNENSSYHSFPSCINSFEILERVVGSEARVLLDVGALMVDLSNWDVATKWLGMLSDRSTIEAAIYFDGDNQIMTVDRDGRTTPLPVSPYQRQMARCVVYLDDVHTRGTDLKIPHGSRACVTLGRGITKDCLVQACMRMRMLGAGHSVSFWASQEVHKSILSILPSPINRQLTSTDVLNWVTRNSVEAIKDGFRHWGSQGIVHCRKEAVNRIHKSIPGGISLQKLGQLNMETEVTELFKCYGSERRVTPLPAIMTSRLQSVAMNMQAEIGVGLDASNIIMDLGRSVIQRIEQYAEGIKCFAQVLDEEQERELEHEMEEEEEIQRPGKAMPRKPVLSPHVRRLATDGWFDPSSSDFLPLLGALQCTSLWQSAEPNAWSKKLFITREFGTVLSHQSSSSGVDFLRPVAWLAAVPFKSAKKRIEHKCSQTFKHGTRAIVLLSPFEVNSLMPQFRHGRGGHLHMVAPSVRAGQNFMLCDRALVLPVMDIRQMTFDDLSLIAQLLAFSGSLFFADNHEQSAYCDFLGLCPRPRSTAEDDAFHRGDIKLDGFIPPEKRQGVKSDCQTLCSFQESPVPFMTKLLSARGWLGHPSASHVGRILFIGQCDTIGNVSAGEIDVSLAGRLENLDV